MARFFRRGAVAALVLALVVIAGFLVRDRILGGRLVSEVQRLSANRSRPVHRSSSKQGTFQACLGPLLDTMPDGASEFSMSSSTFKEERLAIREGTRPVSTMSSALSERLEQVLPWADAVRTCTEAPEVGSAPGLGPFADWDHPRQRGGGLGVSSVVAASMLQVRRDLSGGSSEEALRRCSDNLALARDLVFDRGLVGSALAVAVTRMTLQTCATAVCAAHPDARAAFVEELRRIRLALPPFSEVLVVERAEMQLILFGQFMAGADVHRLPEDAIALAAVGRKQGGSIAKYLFWPEYVGKLDALIEAADGPRRDEVFEAKLRSRSLIERMADSSGSDPTSLLDLARRYELVGRGFDLLEAVAQPAEGALPRSVVRVELDAGVALSVGWMKDERVQVGVCREE